MAQQLETAQFAAFWDSLSESPELAQNISGFADAIRQYVVHVMEATYRALPLRQAARMLFLDDEELMGFITAQRWCVESASASAAQPPDSADPIVIVNPQLERPEDSAPRSEKPELSGAHLRPVASGRRSRADACAPPPGAVLARLLGQHCA